MAPTLGRAALFTASAPVTCGLALKTGISRHFVDRSHEHGVPDVNQIKSVRRADLPTVISQREGEEETVMRNCELVTKMLRTHNQTTMAAEFWDIACNNRYECEKQLPDMTNGCVYVATDARLQAMLARIGRPNPCSFREMFINSFFKNDGCPHQREDKTTEVTSHGGVTYATCDGGFRTMGSTCAKADPVVGDITEFRAQGMGFVNVFVMDAVIGLPDPWEHTMKKRANSTDHRVESVRTAVTGGKAAPIKLEFYSCGAEDELAPREKLEELCHDQVVELQRAHRGEAPCRETVYTPPMVNTGIEFADFDVADLHYIREDIWCKSCDYMYDSLWKQYMPEERGKAKILLCNAFSVLGISAFPGDANRGTMVSWKSMPGGGMKKYDQGKTVIHELGHYFGLYHTFQDSCSPGDRIEDTNAESRPFFGCPSASDIPRTCGEDGIDPVHNFMDYEDDRCMCGFTNEQNTVLQSMARKYIYID